MKYKVTYVDSFIQELVYPSLVAKAWYWFTNQTPDPKVKYTTYVLLDQDFENNVVVDALGLSWTMKKEEEFPDMVSLTLRRPTREHLTIMDMDGVTITPLYRV